MALSYTLVSADHAGVIYEIAVVVFSLLFCIKCKAARTLSYGLRFLLGWLGE